MGIFSYTLKNTFAGKFRIDLNKTNKLLKMLKRIWMPFLALAIVSCSSEITENNDVQNTTTKDTGFVLKFSDPTKMTVRDLALTHCQIMKEMSAINKAEEAAGRELDENILADMANITNPEEAEAI